MKAGGGGGKERVVSDEGKEVAGKGRVSMGAVGDAAVVAGEKKKVVEKRRKTMLDVSVAKSEESTIVVEYEESVELSGFPEAHAGTSGVQQDDESVIFSAVVKEAVGFSLKVAVPLVAAAAVADE